MDKKFSGLPHPDSASERAPDRAIVYVRAVAVADLPEDMQEQIGGLSTVYSVNRADGERVALVADRKLAYALARQHEMVPVAVH